MADPSPDSRAADGLTDEEVEDRLGRLDALLDQIERATGPVAGIAAQAVEALAEVYGTALARVMALAGETPDLVSALVEDELVHHLLILHGVHPQSVEERIARVLDDLRPGLRSHGEVELAGVEDGVARLRWSGRGRGCASSAAAVERVIAESVLAVAPELRGVETVPVAGQRPPPAVIPVESLLRGPDTSALPGTSRDTSGGPAPNGPDAPPGPETRGHG